MNNLVTNEGQCTFRPLGDRVFVKRIPEVSNSLIYIPEAYQKKSHLAEIVAVGTKCDTDLLQIGDVVALPGVAATYPDWEHSDYMMIREADIGGVLTE